jgi:hypothetical protein
MLPRRSPQSPEVEDESETLAREARRGGWEEEGA